MPPIYRFFWLMAAAVVAWGVFHAVGVLLNYDAGRVPALHPLARSLVVVGAVLSFLGFWALMLWQRQRRLRRQAAARAAQRDPTG